MCTVSGQECTDTVGSLDYNVDNIPAPVDRTFILAGYTIPCNATVVAWEFCYQISGSVSATFYPGIWRMTRRSDVVDYTLFQSNEVTYDPSGSPPNLFLCKIFNLTDREQFTAPAGSAVGVYSGTAQLLRTNTDDSVTVYEFRQNQNNVSSSGTDVNYNIALRVNLSKCNGNM